eukprot:224601-Chlamydomonas_euryale.AAC.1
MRRALGPAVAAGAVARLPAAPAPAPVLLPPRNDLGDSKPPDRLPPPSTPPPPPAARGTNTGAPARAALLLLRSTAVPPTPPLRRTGSPASSSEKEMSGVGPLLSPSSEKEISARRASCVPKRRVIALRVHSNPG